MTKDRREAGNYLGWRGPGLQTSLKRSQKPNTSRVPEGQTSVTPPATIELRVPFGLQQKILNIYKNAFPILAEGGTGALRSLLQEVKQALFDRDFERAFGRQDFLEAYAFRWSPSRTLCYLSVLVDLRDYLRETSLFRSITYDTPPSTNGRTAEEPELSSHARMIHVACLGGGAAEVVAFGGLLQYFSQDFKLLIQDTEKRSVTEAMGAVTILDSPRSARLGILLIDAAAWGDIIYKLSEGLMSPPPLSKYASPSAKTANAPLLSEGALGTVFWRENLLDMNKSQLKVALESRPEIITLLFTLNELYTSSITKTTALLLNLTLVVPPGTILLVVDSPGSYSEATIGKDGKKYPMKWLMECTLLGGQKGRREEGSSDWEKLVSDDSRWFRLSKDLKYPISLEDMRYQIHLFRRL